MPPKKGKGKGKKKKEVVLPIPEPQIQLSEISIRERELDLLEDLNDDFFATANQTIQKLMEASRVYEASKMKKYVDIVFNLHRHYAEEVKETSVLRPQVIRAENKLRLALELTANSEEAMERLREALSKAWMESDASLLREQDTQERLQEVMIKCEGLESKEVKKQDDTSEFGHLAKYKNIILRERDRLNGEVIDLEKRLQFQRYYSESLEYINKNNEESMSKLNAYLRMLETEKGNFEIKIRSLQNNLDDQKEINTRTALKMESVNRELTETQKKLAKKIADYDQQKHILEKLRNDNAINTRQLLKNDEEITELRKDQRDNDEIIRTLRLEDKVKANTIGQLTKKYKKTLQDHSSISSKLYKLNRLNHTLGEDISRLKNQINALEKDLLNSTYKFDELRRVKENLQHEREALRSEIIKLNNQIADLKHTIMMQTINIDGLQLDINKLNVKLDEARINVSKSEKERDEMAQEVETLHERIEYQQEQIQLKSNQVTDLSEKLQQKHVSLINVKKQLEVAHSEKMILRRNLETCTQERDNFRILQTKTNHQTQQLTAEIMSNQNKISNLNLQIERLNNDKKELQSELKNKENLLASVRRDLREMKTKNENLHKTIHDDELKFMKMSNDLDETRKEKNLIGLQMVRRNDEIVVLRDKLNNTQTALDQGQTQYNQRVEDIRLLKMEITNLQTERDCLTRAIRSTADMREEIIRLQRSLNQERIKVRSLTEDAKTPTGVHRWRILKGEDPNRYQLLEKVQMLQRRNLKQEIQKEKLQQKLEESHRVCDTLKRVVENLPTTDVKQKLVVTQRINRSQLKKLKALSAELSINQIEMKARECIIDEFKETLKKTKQQQNCEEETVTQPTQSAVSSTVVPYAYSSQDNYMDCIFIETSDPSQDMQELKTGLTV
ncbi:cilia- and flagella-associated protein 58-like [Bactrocera neohumeralis]|uniref:cilia- and flagella-associated protein 58-like n=1 Tax=Bactrocera neohumeralis TaxID=98809 RepID=UPI0021665B67|nr:cilia- and flagella-associated protein 58-like [Bactrocera neohumeralis]